MRLFPSLRRGHPAVIFAPMQGVTDRSMRELWGERGGFTFCVSEYLRVSEHALLAKVFYAHVPEILNADCASESGLPVTVQLLGGDPERLAASAATAVSAGAQSIDLNFGCPAPTVNRHDGGASLLRSPRRIREIVGAVRAAVPASVPVSAKLRLGWDSLDPIQENADMAAQGGASWLTIHARSRVQGYEPPVYWQHVGEVRRRLSLPIVANGDIWTVDDLRRCQDITGCEHFMLGRGALADPWLPRAISAELGIISASEGHWGEAAERPLADWLPVLRRFAEIGFWTYRAQYSPVAVNRYTAMRLKQWLRVASVRRVTSWLDLVKQAETTEDVLHILQQAARGESRTVAGAGALMFTG